MAIQPKNTVDIKVDTLVSKTASAGVKVEGLRFKANGVDAVVSTDMPISLDGTVRWRFDSSNSFNLNPEADLARSIGTSSKNLLNLYAQNVFVSGGNQSIGTVSSHTLKVLTNNLERLEIETDGDIAVNATNGGNLVFARDGYGVVVSGAATFSATGTTQVAAAAVTKLITMVTTATGASADSLRLPTAASHLFKQFMIINESGATLNIFPDSGSNINDAGTNAAITMADNTRRLFFAVTGTRWISTSAI